MLSINRWLYSSLRIPQTWSGSKYHDVGTFAVILVRSITLMMHLSFDRSKTLVGLARSLTFGGWLRRYTSISGWCRSNSWMVHDKSDIASKSNQNAHPRVTNACVVLSWGKCQSVLFTSPSNSIVRFSGLHSPGLQRFNIAYSINSHRFNVTTVSTFQRFSVANKINNQRFDVSTLSSFQHVQRCLYDRQLTCRRFQCFNVFDVSTLPIRCTINVWTFQRVNVSTFLSFNAFDVSTFRRCLQDQQSTLKRVNVLNGSTCSMLFIR